MTREQKIVERQQEAIRQVTATEQPNPNSVEIRLRQLIGDHTISILLLQARVEMLTAENEKLKSELQVTNEPAAHL
jgi:hypothetical protein